jgi:uncharacterized protein YbjT (DUF2867 family)
MRKSETPIAAFVAGATGYTGRHVVEELARRKIAVTAHVRPGSASLAVWTRRFGEMGAAVDTTVWEAPAINETLQRLRPSHVFSLLGTTQARARSDRSGASTYMNVDYSLSTMLLGAAMQSGVAPCFIFLSSLGASTATGNEYLRIRGMVEERIRTSDLPYLIVRPAIISGEDREEYRAVERMSAVMSDSLLGFAALLGAKRWRDRYTSMTGGDLARGIVRQAMAHSLQPGEGRIITYEDLRAEG